LTPRSLPKLTHAPSLRQHLPHTSDSACVHMTCDAAIFQRSPPRELMQRTNACDRHRLRSEDRWSSRAARVPHALQSRTCPGGSAHSNPRCFGRRTRSGLTQSLRPLQLPLFSQFQLYAPGSCGGCQHLPPLVARSNFREAQQPGPQPRGRNISATSAPSATHFPHLPPGGSRSIWRLLNSMVLDESCGNSKDLGTVHLKR
jgi:hypothetical protein